MYDYSMARSHSRSYSVGIQYINILSSSHSENDSLFVDYRNDYRKAFKIIIYWHTHFNIKVISK